MRRRLALVLVPLLLLGAAAAETLRIDDWDSQPAGPVDLSARWQRYPSTGAAFKHPPAVVLDDGRAVLRLVTEAEPLRIGRAIRVNLKKTPWLVWEWKPLVLPEGGDVRDRHRNDQAARVMVAFTGMRGLLYVWDTTAPVGTVERPDDFEIFERVLVVVRSGPDGLGQWSSERRDVYADYRRFFGEEPRAVKLVGLESHSNDTHTRTAVMFGAVRFEARPPS